MAAPLTSVGLVGLGNLGLPLATALVRAGWDLAVLDAHPERAEPVVALGATAVPDVAALADRDVLVLAVPDDAAVEEVLQGYLALDRPGRAVVVHSTVLPQTATRLAEVAAAHGVDLIDAPVSGGAERAEKGTLTVMVGAEPAVLERVRPLLDAVGDPVLHVGPVGAGAAAKLANQLTMFANLAGVYEAIDFAAAHGVATDALLTALETSLGDSWIARNLGFWDRTAAAYDESGTPVAARPWSKDLAEVVQAARAAEVPVPLAGWLAQTLAGRVEAHAREAAR
ncbi:NAD(P)-dependent oxidoreductase [Pseudonocardia kunmingensis]|uniref:3-hydroxyisobutyrate dehydrogenase n=1 Tax=Pseudonocardia kunmingensis TaxID=630975 RepID=A0A543DWV6_9PSEU|nr:NAD(P)-dependent oxidoreductase [Pseudonocardia kunmingensis]TQM13822.1 3-hydroxyisobutyrate dehydrogenase [Pseudonocardia kunmingensis]